ncbi:DNA methylase [Cellulophaga phage phi4:1]|uniref:DNA (cytosine-5-)-methyltransferase n=3 Tax=Lightbulbvirus Cba41 TaxID=1918524 RepID=A0A0S2MWF9_9CAUD|nr:DNA methyltransferase [Cellulophaga phage phi4:1]AGO49441.1 DNA methylase [Cellulophaga phage phi4:1]ALO80037.1 DNA methylase [Cellulophaga phage phi4:1_13]ALO80234.1 DNA methylase [Cellulophaga phage phi4:1_18]
MNVYWIDLFCGAGGTSTGIHLTNKNTKVIACVNHDAQAIKTHKINHPDCKHFPEDIRDWKVIAKLKEMVIALREKEPNCIINIWASLECTHFSKAKGGLARDADSRTLAQHLFFYVEELNPTYLYIENVEEFLTWGPLNEKGRPVVALKGVEYKAWKKVIEGMGYNYEYRIINSADLGAHTSRKRYFGVFAQKGFPISFPTQTHIKRGANNPLSLKPWKAVKELLELEAEGVSIFGLNGKNKPWATKTMVRVYKGMKKFHEEEQQFLTSYYGNGTHHSIDDPCNTLTCKERYAKVTINKQWLVDTQFDNRGRTVEEPCQTLIARMDKKPVYLVSSANEATINNSTEKPGVRPIERLMRYFMRKHGISDVKIRMLFLEELLGIQGFPEDYVLEGRKEEKLKFIGNSVVPLVAKELAESNYNSLVKYYENRR